MSDFKQNNILYLMTHFLKMFIFPRTQWCFLYTDLLLGYNLYIQTISCRMGNNSFKFSTYCLENSMWLYIKLDNQRNTRHKLILQFNEIKNIPCFLL